MIKRSFKFKSTGSSIESSYSSLQKKILGISLLNFLVLALVGLFLRAWPVWSFSWLSYKNVLHAHSHFAFGGWMMPALSWLILQFFPETRTPSMYGHWRNVIDMMLFSSYGMLLSFPFQGYGPISILFSTLSIASGIYLGIVVRSISSPQYRSASRLFLHAAFFYFFLSAIGPFATGPLIAMGRAGTPLYFNAIYFYLHFQYNGYFTFIILAVLYKMIESTKSFNNGQLVFRLMNIACVPAYLLSVLWTKPGIILYIIGGVAAVLQVWAAFFLVKDIIGIVWKDPRAALLFRVAISAFLLKNVLQLLSAIPFFSELAFTNRNFIIAYLHLVLIGFISLFIFASILQNTSRFYSRLMYRGIVLFVFGFISSELVLIGQAAGYFRTLRLFQPLLFGLSSFFPLGLVVMYIAHQKQNAGGIADEKVKPNLVTAA